MQRSSQMSFFDLTADPRLRQMRFFGGALLKKSHSKIARPLSTKDAMHLVLRSSQAKGEKSFIHFSNRKRIERAVSKWTQRFGVKVFQFTNGGDHIHLLVKLKSRRSWNLFIRSLTSEITLITTGTNKLKALKKRFWDQRPFTRVIEWKPGYQLSKDFVVRKLIALGLMPLLVPNTA
ncbi:MAG: transposase [Pseudobdellovibrionaceae bacterium]